jgi:chorismate synthase
MTPARKSIPQVRLLRTLQEFRACEKIQTEVWGRTSVSAEVLKVTQEHGGAVLGAWVGQRLCGFIYAFLGRYRDRLVHWSHLMAVREGQRDRGLGFLMKRSHRRLALRQGLRSICWTFDPLQSRNAALNIGRLGADVEEYVPDYYGDFPSTIEGGLPSDRFVVNWRIALARAESEPGARRGLPSPGPQFRINQTKASRNSFLENERIVLNLAGPKVWLEIPADSDSMRRSAPELARRWRMETRRIFVNYFKSGYRVAGFIRTQEAGAVRCFYEIRRGNGIPPRVRAVGKQG